jgi:hypothetical protein
MATQLKEFVLVKDLAHLKAICQQEFGCAEFFIQLNAGARSSKRISHTPGAKKPWWVLNEIDETEQEFGSDKALLAPANSMIGEALAKQAFYWRG